MFYYYFFFKKKEAMWDYDGKSEITLNSNYGLTSPCLRWMKCIFTVLS
jgi:hypothetical protein